MILFRMWTNYWHQQKITNCYSPYGGNTYFLESFGCNNDSRFPFQELKFFLLNKQRNNNALSMASPALPHLPTRPVLMSVNWPPGPAWPRLFCAAGILDHTGNSWPSHPHHFLYGRRCALRAATTLMERRFPGAGLVSEAMNGAVAADANPLQPDCAFIPPVSSLCDQTRCWLNTSLLMVLKLCCVVFCVVLHWSCEDCVWFCWSPAMLGWRKWTWLSHFSGLHWPVLPLDRLFIRRGLRTGEF